MYGMYRPSRRHKSKSISRLLVALSGDYVALNWHPAMRASCRLNPAGAFPTGGHPSQFSFPRVRRASDAKWRWMRSKAFDLVSCAFRSSRVSSPLFLKRETNPTRIQPAMKDATSSFSTLFHRFLLQRDRVVYIYHVGRILSIAWNVAIPPLRGAIVQSVMRCHLR